MRSVMIAALALLLSSSLRAQANAPSGSSTIPTAPIHAPFDFSTAAPVSGSWIYSSGSGVSEARFINASGQVQLTVRCTIPARRITLSKPAVGPAPFLNLWTSAQSRSLPASFLPSTATLNADLNAYDALLDAMVFSRGRIAVGVSGQPTLVLPAWAETERVVEDCRA